MALSVPWAIHALLPRSLANGPGTRFVIWSQGCSLGCHGCFNPETHARAGLARTAGDLAAEVLRTEGIDGVTLTGGEPLEQPEAVAAFCAEVAGHGGLGIVVLTGFTRAEIEGHPARRAAVAHADMVVAGRYNARRHLGRGLRGSDNKEYWALTDRYGPDDFAGAPDVEITVGPDGTLVLTGLPGLGETL